MKAVTQYKKRWEEAQWIQLILLSRKIYRTFYKFLNLFIFITYQLIKFLWRIFIVALFAEPTHRQIKDELWIYRQIK